MAAQPEYSRQQTGSLRRVADREDPFTSRRRSLWATLLGAAALFSAGAGAIHAATVSYQFGESTLYGITFVTFAVGQIGFLGDEHFRHQSVRWPPNEVLI